MQVEQRKWTAEESWSVLTDLHFQETPQLVLAFGSRGVLSDPQRFQEIKAFYPNSDIITGTTAGEIYNTEVFDDSITLAAIRFDKSTVQLTEIIVGGPEESLEAGKKIASQLPHEGLVHVMIFSDGLKMNGTGLVQGLTEVLPKAVSITGGLMGDGSEFKETLVGLNTVPSSGRVVACGFYGENLRIGYGSLGGWDSFGPERLITKSDKNVLYEIDNKPALSLYKGYLGEKAKELPSAGLLFPMSLRLKTDDNGDVEVVRTLLAVDEEKQSMTFAGDMPEGVYAQLMKANFERLIDGAAGAANASVQPLSDEQIEFAVLISCVGRKLVLKERVEEEVEAVSDILGEGASIMGFYSYGEICPTSHTEKQCQLHNQTMTITTFHEA